MIETGSGVVNTVVESCSVEATQNKKQGEYYTCDL